MFPLESDLDAVHVLVTRYFLKTHKVCETCFTTASFTANKETSFRLENRMLTENLYGSHWKIQMISFWFWKPNSAAVFFLRMGLYIINVSQFDQWFFWSGFINNQQQSFTKGKQYLLFCCCKIVNNTFFFWFHSVRHNCSTSSESVWNLTLSSNNSVKNMTYVTAYKCHILHIFTLKYRGWH